MKKILIAEDNDSNFILMTYMLKGKYDIARARDGKEAIEMVNADSFDLVLMDLKMPVMDGFEATKEIKSQFPTLPIIALTANVFAADRHNAEAAGCNDFLAKPINREKCIATIERFIKEEE